ncbi:hypothetical protein CAPTEDRAFT_116544 [Capitella teleta]|uniref:Major facilitator superfamily associated domain-containing protein n=1 Tax=Capitella teleta TaxID=283909 RepID=R7V3V4_CAPTE|nr:hypothetical protein CAPTEDRAFT_116544 [Capitella teleta]|eukprot:ELU10490.1 hypothetical protein CAPTEDRAFT_116544 [Capitella teleta]
MNKATFHSYIFHLFFGAGQSCLLPFLSLYFRYLGLTASQVGIVFGAKAAVNMIWAPCWTRCSTKFRKKRFVMVFSMFILLGTYGLMIIIPPASQEISDLHANPSDLITSTSLDLTTELLPNPSSTLSITVSVDINASTTPAPLSSTTPVSLLNYFSQDSVYNSFANIMNHIHELPKQINTVIYEKVFAAVMALIIVGEMFSAPAEKLADDTWFEFLDSSDLLEKYGTHKMWMALGCALLPPVLTTAIDRLPCLLAELGQYKIHRILLHFFAFYVLMGLAFVCSICFPIYSTKDGKKVLQRRGRFCRGLRMLFHDVQVSTFTISVLLMGFVQGATSTFLFWLIQDKTGAEQIMGLCLAAAFAGEFFMQGFGRWLVSKVGYAPCVVFGLLVLGGRFAFYSLIADPMYIIAGEGFHCLSVSLIWDAVRTYPDFRLNPLVMDRSANSVMNAFYHGIGLAPGCFTAGYIYDWVGLPILFQSCAVLCGVWAVIFAIVQCCSRKSPKVRYSKLMQDEEEALSDGSMEYDDDWLEVAMKHQK